MAKHKRIPFPALQGPASRALSEAVSRRHMRPYLRRSGALGLARAARKRGHTHEQAARYIAAMTGKGPAAEVSQACSFTIVSATRLRDERCRPNPRANDPVIDLQVLRGTWVIHGVQVKVGRPEYVRAAVESRKYPSPIVANAEACEALWADAIVSPEDVVDRLLACGTAAEQLTEANSIALCDQALR